MTLAGRTRTQASSEAAARRAAKRVGFRAIKSRGARGTADNLGGFRLVDTAGEWIAAGVRYSLSAREVIVYCEELSGRLGGTLPGAAVNPPQPNQ